MPNFSSEFPQLYNLSAEIEKARRSKVAPEAISHLADSLEALAAVVGGWEYDQEGHLNEKIGSSVSLAFYGEKYQGSQIFARTVELSGRENIIDITPTSGFNKIYQITSGLPEESYLMATTLVAKELCQESLQPFGLEKSDLLLVATSVPPNHAPDFHLRIGRAVGVVNPELVDYRLRACDSAGALFYALLSGEYDQVLRENCPQLDRREPVVVTIFAYEDGLRLSHLGGDTNSGQLFSSGAAAWTFFYHPDNPELSTFVKVAGRQKSVQEGASCLRYLDTTDFWPRDQVDDAKKSPFMAPTTGGQLVQMDPEATAFYFRDNAAQLAQEVLEDFRYELEEIEGETISLEQAAQKIKRVVVHHPSKTIFNHLRHKLVGRGARRPGLGFSNDQIQWVISEGNAPATTIPIAFGRQLENIEPDDYVMFLSFGAGGGFTCQVVRVQ